MRKLNKQHTAIPLKQGMVSLAMYRSNRSSTAQDDELCGGIFVGWELIWEAVSWVSRHTVLSPFVWNDVPSDSLYFPKKDLVIFFVLLLSWDAKQRSVVGEIIWLLQWGSQQRALSTREVMRPRSALGWMSRIYSLQVSTHFKCLSLKQRCCIL